MIHIEEMWSAFPLNVSSTLSCDALKFCQKSNHLVLALKALSYGHEVAMNCVNDIRCDEFDGNILRFMRLW